MAERPTVTILGLRGSNEPLSSDGGLGPTVVTIADRLVSEIRLTQPSALCHVEAIPYPASPAHWSLVTGALRASIQAGKHLLLEKIDQVLRGDRAARIVIIGLSQGAASVRLALNDLLVARSDDGSLMHPNVDAVLLYADPLRLANSPCNAAPNPVRDGALTWLWRMRVPIPDAFSDRVRCFCDSQDGKVDPICAFHPGLRTLAGLYGNSIHTTYNHPDRRSGWDGPRFAAERLTARLERTQPPNG